MNPDHKAYLRFSSPLRIERAINSLSGILEGISIDKKLNSEEVAFLQIWVDEHEEAKHRHPFNEIIPALNKSLADNILSQDEKDDLLWLCDKLGRGGELYEDTTTGIQLLHGVLAGIAADRKIEAEELRGLRDWLEDHSWLKTCWPYDEVDSIVTEVMRDGRIDANEHELLLRFFTEFLAIADDRTVTSPPILTGKSVHGLCSVDPEIIFENSLFCFTGASSRFKRKELCAMVEALGGRTKNNVSWDVNYLVIGSDGNPCWAYACYGRKVEQAINLRKTGCPLSIVHEVDFHDAVANFI